MTTPAAMAFSALESLAGMLFMIWHTYHYDRWKCLLYTKDEWFRAFMCHILFGSVMCLQIYTWIDVHVIYAEYWIYYPALDETIVTPWSLYTPAHYKLFRTSLYFITAGWGFLQGVHLEEFLYWAYLIKSINTPGGPRTSWLHSGFFKVWVGLFISCFALLIGSVHIEEHDLDLMRSYLFMVGSCMSLVLAFASIALCIVFPSFLRNVKRQGASFEVLERLYFFSEVNEIRTVCRIVYSVSFLILSADAFTTNQAINSSSFWSDAFYLCGQLGLLSATCLSVVILLPRNMTSESVPTLAQTDNQPMVAYQRPQPDGYSPQQFYELGERLNVGHDALAIGLASLNPNNAGHMGGKEGFEMQVTPPLPTHSHSQDNISSYSGNSSQRTRVDPAPFAESADRSKLTSRLSEFAGGYLVWWGDSRARSRWGARREEGRRGRRRSM
ncbi:hypothetical protein, variant [Cryptococcus amylolentus CBS 6039]|uniref:Uncharacterized protein n=1 Tax=Cryptococcus amylolentus CBS 6039 TaxID=1295533 RepID=A0A1E3HRF2_9TREE|nr:hypothetical protein L202_04434 [Cryptococcus amylolentus CBS 6039]XP_018993953.1 hypothetical protein, variant [Cryptococcus amylolentus CBS 6039]ODN78906.1 hypothetical protein L202_04434 [Cryptococcus amylolentus CBS 6039]ODN78907.1 hypothetical protein, variant [Cryptococcus amylolentus CBS 6039]